MINISNRKRKITLKQCMAAGFFTLITIASFSAHAELTSPKKVFYVMNTYAPINTVFLSPKQLTT